MRTERAAPAGGAHARADEITGVDGVAHHDVEAGLGGGRTEQRGESLVQHLLGILDRFQGVLFGRNVSEALQVRRVAETDVGMGFDQSGHERPTLAVDHLHAIARQGGGIAGHGLDAIALDQNFSSERRRA